MRSLLGFVTWTLTLVGCAASPPAPPTVAAPTDTATRLFERVVAERQRIGATPIRRCTAGFEAVVAEYDAELGLPKSQLLEDVLYKIRHEDGVLPIGYYLHAREPDALPIPPRLLAPTGGAWVFLNDPGDETSVVVVALRRKSC